MDNISSDYGPRLQVSARSFFIAFLSLFTRFFVTLDKLLHLGMKKEQVLFVLLSFFRNFAE